MTYRVAKNCFKENITLTGGAQKDPVSFNLYNGLFQLTQQLEQDNAALEARLQKAEEALRNLVRR